MSFIKKLLGMDGEDVTKVIDSGADVAKAFSNKEQGTRRQALDMLADTPLSKNIRPLIALWAMLLLTGYLVCVGAGVKFDEQVGETVFWLIIIVMGFYFPGRTAEKWIKRK